MEMNSMPSSTNMTGMTGSVKNGTDSTVQIDSYGSVGYVPNTSPSATELLKKEKFELSISEEAVVKAIQKANKALQGVEKRFEYRVHQKTGEIMVKVLNQETNEIIREIPPEKLLDLVAKLQDICGIIIDEKR
ncbi:flagellar protein FlaG [Paenibacillus ehimensis]|uniref:Flagellar protein FlaG n=1 Tax=Paenibacillus ehimensis TaxID=79264 RepID=A0ABT8VCV2_9BACL|nr:flagellar protein FlaG [Paenibacillus ehimensis]MDO3678815.1 flagellar protein FlaG [Paenibacillus ehimensis]MEC0209438.1 flagellar protein FlaG [Paenibacillus ehimensis]